MMSTKLADSALVSDRTSLLDLVVCLKLEFGYDGLN